MLRRIRRRSAGLGLVGGLLTALGTGAASAGARQFLFIQARGGWDPLSVFAPFFDSAYIQMGPGDAPMQIGGLQLVGSHERPNVETFFRRFGERTLILNGLATRSVNHEACEAVANTGTLEHSAVDWATFLAQSSRDAYLLPHATMQARVFPGDYASLVGSVEGRFREMLDGTLAAEADVPARAPLGPSSERVDRHLLERLEASTASGDDMAAIYLDAALRSRALATAGSALAVEPAEDRRDRIDNALRLLSSGLVRCASLGGPQFEWDAHEGNNNGLFDGLFDDLTRLVDKLDAEVASDGTLLADKIVIVVTSEMGRTPLVNADGGRDHWPFTSAMVIGRGITGGRKIGGFAESYIGVGVDPTTGELAPEQRGISCESFGATLLALGDVDPGALLPGVEPITAVLT